MRKIITEKLRGKGVKFERLRRITGFLSYLDTWNNGKRAELADRKKHEKIQ